MKAGKIVGFICCLMLVFVLGGCACEHEFGDWATTTPATCVADGLQQRVCAKCNATEERVIMMTDHRFGEWKTVKEATCLVEGLQQKVCTKCGGAEERAIARTGHVMGEWTVQLPTCAADGKEEHSCIYCGLTESFVMNRNPHAFGPWQITQAPTCVALGVQTRYCSGCNATEEAALDLVAHTYGSWKITKSSTCTEDGTQSRTCSVCSKEETASMPSGHKWIEVTCTAPKTCAVCRVTEGSALGHAKGSNAKCTRCGIRITTDMRTLIAPPKTMAYLRDILIPEYEIWWSADNLSGKTISTVTGTIAYYNADGDLLGRKDLYLSGPVAPGETIKYARRGMYVSEQFIEKMVVEEVTLQYSDGTADTGWYGWGSDHQPVPEP